MPGVSHSTLNFGSLSRSVENRVVAAPQTGQPRCGFSSRSLTLCAENAPEPPTTSPNSVVTATLHPRRVAEAEASQRPSADPSASRVSDLTRPSRPLPSKPRPSGHPEFRVTTGSTTEADATLPAKAAATTEGDLEDKIKRMMEEGTQQMQKVMQEQAERLKMLEEKLAQAGMSVEGEGASAPLKPPEKKRKRSAGATELTRKVAELEDQLWVYLYSGGLHFER